MNCYVAAAAGLSLLGGSLWTMSAHHVETAKFKRVLTPEQVLVYQGIIRERRNHYIQGLVLGLLTSFFLQTYLRVRNGFHSLCLFLAVTLFVTVMYYSIAPKSDFMLRHLETPEQVEAWLEVYRNMKFRYMFGVVLGALSSVAFSRVLC
jgi:hypothetical protein